MLYYIHMYMYINNKYNIRQNVYNISFDESLFYIFYKYSNSVI